MHPRYGRAYGAARATITAPYKRGNFMTIFGAISLNKIEAVTYTEGPGNSDAFTCFINDYLCPSLKSCHVVIMDNVSFHKAEKVRFAIESKGAKLIYSPPYSPEFSPIEEMWSKIKILLRKFSARTKKKFNEAITKALMAVTKSDLFGWFNHAGYIDQDFRELL